MLRRVNETNINNKFNKIRMTAPKGNKFGCANKGRKRLDVRKRNLENNPSKKGRPKPKGFGEIISRALSGRNLSKEHRRNSRRGIIRAIKNGTKKPPWNIGLTKEDDERIRAHSKRMEKDNPMKNPEIAKRATKKAHLIIKKLWKTKKFREQTLRAQRRGMKLKPNKPEKLMISLIEENKLPFNYVGNGQIWVGGFNPDFLSKNPKHIIEVFGDYWHNLPKVKKRDKRRFRSYKEYGYKTLVIWEHELSNQNKVLNKIKGFLR